MVSYSTLVFTATEDCLLNRIYNELYVIPQDASKTYILEDGLIFPVLVRFISIWRSDPIFHTAHFNALIILPLSNLS